MLTHIPSLSILIGKYHIFTEDEVEELDRIEIPRERISSRELYAIFPQAQTCLAAEIKKNRKELDDIAEDEQKSLNFTYETVPVAHQWFAQLLIHEFLTKPKQQLAQTLKRQQFLLSSLKNKYTPQKDAVTDADIARAKDAEISHFYDGELKLVGHTLRGVCELHNEKSPSFFIYKDENRWYCYGEHDGGDAIDYVMRKFNLRFLDAVRFILHE